MPRWCFLFILILMPFYSASADPKQTFLDHQALLQANELEAAHKLWRNPNEQPWQVMMAFICAFYQDLDPAIEHITAQCDGQDCILTFDAPLREETHTVKVYLSLHAERYLINKIIAEPKHLSFLDTLSRYF
ncbi:hypothetical protein [Pseudoalteromonas ulvae]|nr:hypothetical protein [Pseudoalteromonas ulvae]